jgi:hypothetical protein
MDEFSKVLEVVTRVMREGAATHPDNEWTRLGPEYHVIRAERNLSSLREGADHVSHACTPGVDVESDRLMIGKVMKCGRCGQWIPLAQWKYAARRFVHDNCAAVFRNAIIPRSDGDGDREGRAEVSRGKRVELPSFSHLPELGALNRKQIAALVGWRRLTATAVPGAASA